MTGVHDRVLVHVGKVQPTTIDECNPVKSTPGGSGLCPDGSGNLEAVPSVMGAKPGEQGKSAWVEM